MAFGHAHMLPVLPFSVTSPSAFSGRVTLGAESRAALIHRCAPRPEPVYYGFARRPRRQPTPFMPRVAPMAQPWLILDSVPTPEGTLELRRRGESDFLITVGGQVLMNSSAHRSEVALGALGCRGLRRRAGARVLVGGLGMGFTLRAVLDSLPDSGRAIVAELNPVVLQWCRGPLAALTARAVDDPRVTVEVADVADLICRGAQASESGRFNAIVLDLYQGPHAGSRKREDPLYGSVALELTRAALVPGGVFAVWGESHDAGFEKRLKAAGFQVTCERPGFGGLRHEVYVATAKGAPSQGAGPRGGRGGRPGARGGRGGGARPRT